MYDKSLPLVDLHRHLDGNIRPKTIWELASNSNFDVPASSFEEFLPHVQIQSAEADLLSFLKKLDWGVSILNNLDTVKRIAYENVEDAYLAGLNYAELRFSPYYMAMTHKLNIKDVVEAVIDGVNTATKTFSIKINLIGILSRTNGQSACMDELEAILAHKENIIALDLAGDEINFPAHLFSQHFKLARANGLEITAHAGEAKGPESIWQVIKLLGAKRIGHGVAAARDPYLMEFMLKNDIAIESCLTSNIQTGTVNSLPEHPITQFIDFGLKVSLNTDDPAIEGIEIKDEYQKANDIVGLNLNQIQTLQKNGVESSFLSKQDKDTLYKQASER